MLTVECTRDTITNMLDEINTNIVLELYKDGRSSNADLATKLDINTVTVAKRVQTMIEEGIIRIQAVPNPYTMGYNFGAFIGLDVDLTRVENICAQLIDNDHVSLVVTCFGRFDVLLIVYFYDRKMLQSFIGGELHKIEGVNHIETYLISETKHYEGIFKHTSNPSELTQIDETDQKLIRELMQNGRARHADLAIKLGIDTSTVSRRIASLVKREIIKIIAIPDLSKLGYSASAIIGISADLDKVEEICNQLSKYREVQSITILMNGFEILINVNFPNSEILYEFIKSSLTTIDGVKNTETFIRGKLVHFNSNFVFLPPTGHP